MDEVKQGMEQSFVGALEGVEVHARLMLAVIEN